MPMEMIQPDLAIASFLIPLMIAAVTGAARGGFSANEQAKRENERRLTADQQRDRLNNLLARIRNVNYDDVNSAQSAAFTEASNAAAANAAQRGLRGGVVDASQDRVLGQAIADLARFKQQQQQTREQAEGRVLQEEAFAVPEDMLDVVQTANQGALMGMLGGSMDVLGPALSSEDVIRALSQGAPTGNPSEADLLAFQEDPLGFTFGPGGRQGTSASPGSASTPSAGSAESGTGRVSTLGTQGNRQNTYTTGPRNDSMNLRTEPEPTSGVIGPALQRALVRSRNTRNIA